MITIFIPSPSFGPQWLRGLVDLGFVASFFYAGSRIWRGRRVGCIQGMVIAAAGAVRWALHVSVAPVASATALIMEVLMIASLWMSAEHFYSST